MAHVDPLEIGRPSVTPPFPFQPIGMEITVPFAQIYISATPTANYSLSYCRLKIALHPFNLLTKQQVAAIKATQNHFCYSTKKAFISHQNCPQCPKEVEMSSTLLASCAIDVFDLTMTLQV